ncbi:Stp1/IreP family PP2C-type Ser/Thr phosphatase [Clostridium formicaceticum]|uniref:Protein phosphatase n=1 Tax=Clostridium formicaceticum TaxID=1497 RepID=A0AAC9WGK6_9CLOT|nr:Stp1/IreP family PP2C-type Ser/Thr phosphatase [Clostridium formicaceticum]AOY77368.1 protein phosphatase [Clostridium formicaceticum]ARE87914.1 Serine/threonine phosphatase stp [Clostridium formicaceticum]
MTVAAITDIGKVREVNEDNYCIYEKNIKLYMVADGMGGHKSGEVASFIAINTIKDHIRQFITEDMEKPSIEGIIFEAFHRANKEIYNKSIEDFNCEGMGTTVTMALIIRNKIYIGHVGDSRGYVLRGGELEQVTQDHSLVAELVRNGSITEREAMKHPQKNIITRSLGTSEKVKVDIFSLDLCEGDILLLCTDGLTNFVDKHELEKALLTLKDCMETCKELVSLANQRGGYDNITVLIGKDKPV